jgi:hypothetical protein
MGKEIKVYFKRTLPNEREIFSGQSKRVAISGEEDDYASYVETDMRISVNDVGDIYLYDYTSSDSSIFIYSDQLEHFEEALKIAFAQRKLNP